ncbi:MAG: hypothetical protein IMZ47_03145 [Firmicutes bacterium]|nr:hypothetical protein [Bacillota bacterium]
MNKKILGVFAYDLFPGMVVHEITNWEEDGGVTCKDIGTFKPDSLIAVFPKKQGEKIRRQLSIIKAEYAHETAQLRKEFLDELFDKFPTLQKCEA